MSVISTLQPASLGCFHGLLAEKEEEWLLNTCNTVSRSNYRYDCAGIEHTVRVWWSHQRCLGQTFCSVSKPPRTVPRRWSSICHKEPLYLYLHMFLSALWDFRIQPQSNKNQWAGLFLLGLSFMDETLSLRRTKLDFLPLCRVCVAWSPRARIHKLPSVQSKEFKTDFFLG